MLKYTYIIIKKLLDIFIIKEINLHNIIYKQILRIFLFFFIKVNN